MKIPIGTNCRKCSYPLVKRKGSPLNRKGVVKNTRCYYKEYFVCANCHTVYLEEKYKILITPEEVIKFRKVNEQGVLF